MRHLGSLCRRMRAPALAAPGAAGRWEGVADVPGNPLRLVVDLDPGANGRWDGSVILPDRGVKGAPLDELAVSGCDVRTEGERRFEARGLHGMQPRTQTFADMYDVFLSSPLVVDGKVYFGSGDGHVYAVDAASGRLAWKFRTGDVVHASPAYADGLVVLGSWDGRLYALDAATGAQRWAFQAGVDPLIHNQQGFQSSAAIADGTVYVGCRDGHLYAIE